ncbi:RNA polymerase sigma-70 factor (ECF subfamily) [Pedobacter psychrotolerans]|uniref:DNA-directed RNA polymerase sigma-70 factor n=1 Tax=Pedobacter psychrotolerans TaxID=1843235 RepID=A0A4R2H8L4_9SPHI|nr:RNA polymerase sigma-70 factor [Pedobacter psychrotolerans]TCO22581.1 RNA polymerase sigma-70 factor (ECF subfamily) [Pedobacter psychrotolerans]GGE65658.1 DNA-directed RNA polymerase sigma-70 factor [Pedobacter psychrotolerans]
MEKLESFNQIKLLNNIKNGDSAAFNELYYQYRQKIYGYAHHFTRCKEEAEELTQDTFVRLWENRAKINPERNFDAFLYTLVRNNFLMVLRKKAREKAYSNENLCQQESFNAIEDELNAKESKRIAQNAIETLSPQVKKIYLMSRDDHHTHEEISQLMGISKNTVNNHLKKSLSIMRKYFKTYSPETILSLIAFICC